MRTRPIPRWPWLLSLGLFMQTSLAAAQEPPNKPQHQLSPDMRGRIAEAAGNPSIAAWQREVMLDVARGGIASIAAGPLPAPLGTGPPTAGIAADDGAWIEIPTPARTGHTAIY